MSTHSIIFVTIDKLISPSSSVNGNPLDDFPDHWQPRFSVEFPLPGTSEGANLPAPFRTKESLQSCALGKPGRQAVGSVVSRVALAKPDITHKRGIN